jgi:hypothetical protein
LKEGWKEEQSEIFGVLKIRREDMRLVINLLLYKKIRVLDNKVSTSKTTNFREWEITNFPEHGTLSYK